MFYWDGGYRVKYFPEVCLSRILGCCGAAIGYPECCGVKTPRYRSSSVEANEDNIVVTVTVEVSEKADAGDG